MREQTYLLGPNASGKSNLLDVFRFLRDVSKPQGGGLQKVISDRGGIPKLRCLHARRDPEVRIEVQLAESAEDPIPAYRYILGFKSEGKGRQRAFVSAEEVWQGKEGTEGNEECLQRRPMSEDEKDPARLTQTHLEQIQSNEDFREIAAFFGSVTCLHLVPQLLKYGNQIGGQRLEHDPFGQGFLERVAKASERVRKSRLERIQKALLGGRTPV